MVPAPCDNPTADFGHAFEGWVARAATGYHINPTPAAAPGPGAVDLQAVLARFDGHHVRLTIVSLDVIDHLGAASTRLPQ
jgi:hypothetical protein